MRRAWIGLVSAALMVTMVGGALPAAAATGPEPVVIASTHTDVSPPLSTLAGGKDVVRTSEVRELDGDLPVPFGQNAKGGSGGGSGGAIGSPPGGTMPGSGSGSGGVGADVSPAPIVSFDGLSNADNAAVYGGGVLPPDPNGDVGPNHYVQAINLLIRVFDKTGTALTGPTKMSSLFTGFGGLCETTDKGDPIVQYDPLADRWLLTQFAFPAGLVPAHQCVAVSTSPDPTGSYYRYSFDFPTLFNDYGKVGVWNDAYYMSFHMFTGGGSYAGQGVAALDRDKMLVGAPATMIFFNNPGYGGMTPSDVVGFTPPPAGAPNMFFDPQDGAFEGGADRVDMWAFDADFVTPGNSTFTLSSSIPVQAFDPSMCAFARNCIPQPGTAQGVDALSYRNMNVVAYRNMGAHEAWVGNFTVDADGADHAGVRWYEVRKVGAGAPSLHQDGTHAPDADHRWMGSVSIDSAGDIAAGYSVSSSTTYPSIRYATRVPGDTLGTLQTEATLMAGSGSQTHSAARWGDYSSMSVDPSDDCTFWYTTEYLATTGSAPWLTRVGSFKVPSCVPYTPVAADLGVSFSGVPANSTTGSNFSYTVTVANTGPSTAPAVGLTHNLPSDLTVVSAVPSQGTCGPVSPMGCQLGAIASGGSASIAMTVKPTANGVHAIDAAVSSLAYISDSVPGNNTANASTTSSGGAPPPGTNRYTTGDVSIPIPPTGTGPGTTEVIINVPDTGTITDVNMEIRLDHTWDADLDIFLEHPDGTVVSLSTDNGGSGDDYGSGADDCTGTPTIFDDEAATSITAGTPPFAGSFRPEGMLSDFDGKPMTGDWILRIHDDVSADEGDLFCATIEIATGGAPPAADLAFTLVDLTDPVAAGEAIPYEVTVDNYGPGISHNITVVVDLPTGTTFVPGGPCSAIGTMVTCGLASLAPGGAWTFGIDAMTDPATPHGTVVTASGSVSAVTPDPDTSNNDDDEDTTINRVADLRISSWTGPTYFPASGGTFTVTATNDGPSVVQTEWLVVDLPAGMTMVSASGGSCIVQARRAQCTLYAAVAPGGTHAVTFTARGMRGGRYAMQATVRSTAADPNLANNFARLNVSAY